MTRSGSVRGATSCWLVWEVEESLAHASGFLWISHAIEFVEQAEAALSRHRKPLVGGEKAHESRLLAGLQLVERVLNQHEESVGVVRLANVETSAGHSSLTHAVR